MCRPPAALTASWRFCHSALIAAFCSSVAPSPSSWISASSEPPSTMSVPRPAMLVAMVTAAGRPALATMVASRSCCLALSTSCFTPALRRCSDNISEVSIEVVPTSTGWPRLAHSSMSASTALNLPLRLRNTWSGLSLRMVGRLVGITTTSRP
ncbi:hypothetical protein D3C72_1216570 [compost metagenome]